MNVHKTYDVIIIGAGAAGVGLGVLFEKMGLRNYLILEKDTVGSSFKRWSAYTHFISPSFSGNAFGAVDLNAITPDTSPGHTLKSEHPTGRAYATYLELIANYFNLNISEGVNVTGISRTETGFEISSDDQKFAARTLVWAGGEFQYPKVPNIPGAEHSVHSSTVQTIGDDHVTVIGGYESGMDIAKAALDEGASVTIIDSGAPWDSDASDHSISLSPRTHEKLRPYSTSDRLTLVGHTRITALTKTMSGYELQTETGGIIPAPNAPIFATGFENLAPIIAPYFDEDGAVLLTEDDESTITPGCFLVGPKVQHGAASFCFIYKFRQRLPVVAEAIVSQLDLDLTIPTEYQRPGMYLKDLSCCGDECAC